MTTYFRSGDYMIHINPIDILAIRLSENTGVKDAILIDGVWLLINDIEDTRKLKRIFEKNNNELS